MTDNTNNIDNIDNNNNNNNNNNNAHVITWALHWAEENRKLAEYYSSHEMYSWEEGEYCAALDGAAYWTRRAEKERSG